MSKDTEISWLAIAKSTIEGCGCREDLGTTPAELSANLLIIIDNIYSTFMAIKEVEDEMAGEVGSPQQGEHPAHIPQDWKLGGSKHAGKWASEVMSEDPAYLKAMASESNKHAASRQKAQDFLKSFKSI